MKRAELDRRIANGETLEDIVPVLMDDGADITSYDDLKRFAIEKIESDELYLAEHVLKACLDVADYYGYDYSMGTLENPTAIDGVEDLIDYVEDSDGGSTGHPGGCPFSLAFLELPCGRREGAGSLRERGLGGGFPTLPTACGSG